MSSKSKETINIVELVGIGYSFTDITYRAQEAAGEYIIFYSLTETQRNSLHFLVLAFCGDNSYCTVQYSLHPCHH